MQFSRFIPAITITALVVTACDGDVARQDADIDQTQRADADRSDLTAAQIAQLVERYPRLRADPLPEPEPSPGADPAHVPSELASRLSEPALETVTGQATFYANKFEGRRTASGIPFRQNQLVAAHRGFPFGTIVRVTNMRNDRSVNVRIVDRGPFGASAARGTVIDLSRRAAERLDFIAAGRAQVRVEVLEWGRGIRSV